MISQKYDAPMQIHQQCLRRLTENEDHVESLQIVSYVEDIPGAGRRNYRSYPPPQYGEQWAEVELHLIPMSLVEEKECWCSNQQIESQDPEQSLKG